MTDSKSRPASHKSILRVKKTNNYVVLDKGFLQDPSLSCKAKGLLSYLLSKPDDWEIRLSELCRHFSDGKDSIRKGIEELEKAGYIKKERLRGGNGKFAGVRYMVYETPCLSQKEPQTEKPDTVFPAPENPTLLNNDLTKDTSYRVATNFEVSFMSKRECIKKTARLIEDLGVENSYKVAAA
ncbi:MAG TPA: helix-turn-helix domain-containing protein, partial [Mesotoga sp.]|nr:helix-turn-helix domain-containing protein [Mesotoga sp.]